MNNETEKHVDKTKIDTKKNNRTENIYAKFSPQRPHLHEHARTPITLGDLGLGTKNLHTKPPVLLLFCFVVILPLFVVFQELDLRAAGASQVPPLQFGTPAPAPNQLRNQPGLPPPVETTNGVLRRTHVQQNFQPLRVGQLAQVCVFVAGQFLFPSFSVGANHYLGRAIFIHHVRKPRARARRVSGAN